VTIFSVDCEFTGPYPVSYNLLSVGVVAYSDDGGQLGEWYSAIPNRHIVWDTDTLLFWKEQGLAFDKLMAVVTETTKHLSQGDVAFSLQRFITNMHTSKERPVFLADPCNADFPWVDVLFRENGYDNPFGYKGLCLGSIIRAKLGLRLYDKVRDLYPSEDLHHALADAKAQGKTYFKFIDPTLNLDELKKALA
jgi:hypothetical protein